MTPAQIDGVVTSGPPYPMTPVIVSVRVGDIWTDVLYACAAPGMIAGIMQVNFRVPMSMKTGVYPVQLVVGRGQSQDVKM